MKCLVSLLGLARDSSGKPEARLALRVAGLVANSAVFIVVRLAPH